MDVLKEATAYLKTKGIENPRLNAEQLLGHVLGLSRMDLYLRFEQPLSSNERNRYKTLLRRKADHEPLQYILNETEFMSLPFKVTPDVLIPRPETETLVERIIEETDREDTTRFLDIGVGSGNIVVSLAKVLPKAEFVGVDTNDRVLTIARENTQRNGLEKCIRFLKADILEEGFGKTVEGPFDMIVSNPPYISLLDWETLPREIQGYEPKSALCDNGDGLTFFRIIAQKSRELFQAKGKLFFEVGDGQSEKVQTILIKNGYQNVAAFPDLNFKERVIMGTYFKENRTATPKATAL